MLQALGIAPRHRLGDAEGTKEGKHPLVAHAGGPGEARPCRGEHRGAVGRLADEAGGDQPIDRLHHRHVRDAHEARKVGHPARPTVGDDAGDRLDVVLGGLAGMVAPHLAETVGGRQRTGIGSRARRGHAYHDVAMATPLSRAIAVLAAVAAALAAVAALAAPRAGMGTTPARDPRAGRAVRIVATTTQCADLASTICAGIDGIEVVGLMHPGVDPHLWRPTVSDVRRLAEADAVVCNGLMLEGRMSDVFPKLARRGTRVVELATAVPMDRLIAEGDGHAAGDPHVWMDPAIWELAGHALADALGAMRPGDADRLHDNAERFGDRCRDVSESVERAVATIPERARLMVTAHDAFRYFGRAFGIEVRGVQGISTESQAGLADMKSLADAIIDRRVPAVFVETSVPDRAVAALIESAAVRGHALRVGGSLYSDAMGDAGTPQARWEGMMLHNARTIVEALGGDTSSLGGNSSKPSGGTP